MYQMAQVELLSPEEELAHFQAIEAGKFAERSNPRNMPRAELLRYTAVVNQAEASFDVVVQHNIRMVYKVVYSFRKPENPEFDDLIQDGVVGLIEAARKFNYKLGWRFNTYAYKYILNAIRRNLERKYSKAKLGDKLNNRLRAVEKLKQDLEEASGIPLTLLELQDASGLSERLFSELEPYLAARLYQWSSNETEEADATTPYSTAHKVEETVLREEIASLVLSLPPLPQQCILLRLGYDQDGKKRKVEEVGQLIGRSRESVRIFMNEGFALLKPILLKRGLHLLLEELGDLDPAHLPDARRK